MCPGSLFTYEENKSSTVLIVKLLFFQAIKNTIPLRFQSNKSYAEKQRPPHCFLAKTLTNTFKVRIKESYFRDFLSSVHRILHIELSKTAIRMSVHRLLKSAPILGISFVLVHSKTTESFSLPIIFERNNYRTSFYLYSHQLTY